jgi:hypothetical protein
MACSQLAPSTYLAADNHVCVEWILFYGNGFPSPRVRQVDLIFQKRSSEYMSQECQIVQVATLCREWRTQFECLQVQTTWSILPWLKLFIMNL